MEDPETNSYSFSHYFKKLKIYIGEKTALSINGAGKIGYLHSRRLKLDSYRSSCTKINSKSKILS
jgi:hypothetical protein